MAESVARRVGGATVIPFPGRAAKAPSGPAGEAPAVAIARAAGEAGLQLAALSAGSLARNLSALFGPAMAGTAELGRVAASLAADQARDDLELLAGSPWRGVPCGYLAARAVRPLHLAACCLALARGLAWPGLAAPGGGRVEAA